MGYHPDTLLLGSCGFIGGAVREALRESGRVMTAGRSGRQDIFLDLSAPIPRQIAGYGFTTLIHCAGVTDEEMAAQPEIAWLRTVRRLPELIGCLKNGGLTRIIYVSTAHVYGKLDRTISEETRANPISQYALAHYAAEQIVRHSGCGAVILRPSTVYGISKRLSSFSRYRLIPYLFPGMAVKQEKIALTSTGAQTLNFVDVAQIAARVAQFAWQQNLDAVSCHNEAGTRHISVFEYARMVTQCYEELTGRPCRLTTGSAHAGGADFRYLSSFPPAEEMTVEDDIRGTIKNMTQSGITCS